MPIDKTELLKFLKEVDKALDKAITLTAVGGTAMTLLGTKSSTIDIDFDLSREDAVVFRKALKSLPHGYRIDIFIGGMIFSQYLPQDYIAHCRHIKSSFEKIKLLALSPLDIIVTKIGRLNERDIEDIKACIQKFRIGKKEVEKRAMQVVYIGHEENYKTNLAYSRKELF